MEMTLPILAIWILTGTMLVAGVALLIGAAFLSAKHLRVRRPVVGERGCCCAKCGYCTDGLEEAICPECGEGFVQGARIVEHRRRWKMVAVGVVALASSSLGYPATDAALFGVPHALATPILIEALAWSPASHGAIANELQVRADSGMMRTWERRRLARVALGLVESQADGSLRRGASNLLTRVAGEADERAGNVLLRDRDPMIRADATTLLARRGHADTAARKRLAAMACSERSAFLRKRAIDALRYLSDGGAEAQSALTKALLDPNDGVRKRALFALSEKELSPAAMHAVAGRAEDVDEEVREVAVWTLLQLAAHHRAGIGALTNLLADASPVVREGAAWALGVLRGESSAALPRLATVALGDENPQVRVAAMTAIRTIRG